MKAIGCMIVIPSGVEGSRLGPAGLPLGWSRDPAVAGQVISTPALRAPAPYDLGGHRTAGASATWARTDSS